MHGRLKQKSKTPKLLVSKATRRFASEPSMFTNSSVDSFIDSLMIIQFYPVEALP